MSGDGDGTGDPGAPGNIGSMGTSPGDPGQGPAATGQSGDFATADIASIDPTVSVNPANQAAAAATSMADDEANVPESFSIPAAPNVYGKSWGKTGPAAGKFSGMTNTVEPPSGLGLTSEDTTTEDVANAMGRAGELSMGQAISLGAAKSGVVDSKGNLNPLAVISPTMSLVAAIANAPHGSLGDHGMNSSDPGGEDGGFDGPAGAVVLTDTATSTPTSPMVVDTGATGAPIAKTDTGTGTPAGDSAGPTVTPGQSTAAPGTLLRRRRRTQTILTSPQGVLGGSAMPARRTRSLSQKTLLGG